jgi:hypothetical protein
MPAQPAKRPRRIRFRERHPTLIRGVLELIAGAGLAYLMVEHFLH